MTLPIFFRIPANLKLHNLFRLAEDVNFLPPVKTMAWQLSAMPHG